MRKRRKYILLFAAVAVLAVILVEIRHRGKTIKPGSFVQLDLSGSLPEAPSHGLLTRILNEREENVVDLLHLLQRIGDDERIDGIVVRLGALEIGWAKAQEIRDALREIRAKGKKVVALLEQEAGGSTKEHYIASVAQPIYLSPSSTAPFNGLAAQFLFLGGVWEKLDVEMNVEKIREYKTYGDMIAYKEMTPAHREMANSLLDSMSAQVVSGIASDRQLDVDAVRALMDRAPSTGRELEDGKLTDGVKHLQDIKAEISPDKPFIELKEYAASIKKRTGFGFKRKLAVVYAAGNIVSGPASGSPGSDLVGSDTLSKAFEDAQEDSSIEAIILRIDSPGGSALASDIIWRATQSARKRKPLVVSMSDVSASGGYYIAAGADRIVAEPGTLTGSIGVVSMRPYVRNLLQRLGVNSETITRGRFADLNDLMSPLDGEHKQHVVAEMQHVYDVFVDRVAEGRHLTTEGVDQVGRGRVWTGEQAKEHGLVDELGGFRVAERIARELVGIPADEEVGLVYYPKPDSALGEFVGMFATQSTATVPRLLRQVTQAVLLPFEENSILARMPAEIELR